MGGHRSSAKATGGDGSEPEWTRHGAGSKGPSRAVKSPRHPLCSPSLSTYCGQSGDLTVAVTTRRLGGAWMGPGQGKGRWHSWRRLNGVCSYWGRGGAVSALMISFGSTWPRDLGCQREGVWATRSRGLWFTHRSGQPGCGLKEGKKRGRGGRSRRGRVWQKQIGRAAGFDGGRRGR